jgi:peroxiredoxin
MKQASIAADVHPAQKMPVGRDATTRRDRVSSLLRTGLSGGTKAPDFDLTGLCGGRIRLSDYLGTAVIVVFTSPACGPCLSLLPEIQSFHARREVQVLMVMRGSVEAARTLANELGLSFPIGIQEGWQVSRTYGIFATPSAFLIDDEGLTAGPVAVGGDEVAAMLTRATRRLLAFDPPLANVERGPAQRESPDKDDDTGSVRRKRQSSALPKSLLVYAQNHIRTAWKQQLAAKWEKASLGRVQPILRPDIEGIAYYEVEVVGADGDPMGFMMLSTGRHDFPIVRWRTHGRMPTDEYLQNLPIGRSVSAFYWIEPNLVAEDPKGELVAGRLEHAAGLVQRRRTHGVAHVDRDHVDKDQDQSDTSKGNDVQPTTSASTNIKFEVDYGKPFRSWRELKRQYKSSVALYLTALQTSAAPYWLSATDPIPFKDGAQAPQCAVPDAAGTPAYSQVHSYTGPNTSWCASGCGPTAWAILMGWEDRQAARGDPRFAPYWAIYHKDGALDWFAPDDVAPMSFDPGPQNTMMQLNRILGTDCVYHTGESEGSTIPWKMSRINTYLQRQGFMADSIEAATFDWGGGEWDSLRDRAIKHICIDQVPAVVGVGALAHYAVATETFGYWFYFNMGHAGQDDGWYAPGVFFAGTILPKKQPVVAPGKLIAAGGECLEIENSNPAAGTSVVTTDCADRNSQKWLLMPDKTIRGIAEKCLDVDHSKTADGSRIQSWDCNGTGAQTWSFQNFEIVSRGNGLCIDVTAMVNADGTLTQLWDCLGFWNQRWRLTDAGEIANTTGRCLDVSGNTAVNGTSVDISTCNGSPAQKWVILPGGYIQGLGGMCLTALGSANGARLVLWERGGQPLQQWSLRGPIQGLAGKCLDITDGLPGTWAVNGQSVSLWTCTENANQEWTLVT